MKSKRIIHNSDQGQRVSVNVNAMLDMMFQMGYKPAGIRRIFAEGGITLADSYFEFRKVHRARLRMLPEGATWEAIRKFY